MRRVAVVSVLALGLLLASCQTQPSQAPPQSSTGKVPKVGSASVGSDIQQTVENGKISVEFTVPMDRASVEQALALFPAYYAPGENPAGLTSLALTFLCNGTWKVTNPNAAAVSFTWDMANTNEQGVGVVPANSSVRFYSVTNGKKGQLYVDGVLQDEKQSYQEPCNQPKGSFSWSADGTTLTFTPAAALNEEQPFTLVLSTGAKSRDGVALEEPYIGAFQASISQAEAVEIGRETLANEGVTYDPERDLVVALERLLEGEPVYLVGYWVRSGLPEYDDREIFDENALSIAPGAVGPPFVPGGERNVYISKETGQVIKVEFTR